MQCQQRTEIENNMDDHASMLAELPLDILIEGRRKVREVFMRGDPARFCETYYPIYLNAYGQKR
jgi:hypothetical protein